MYKRAFVEISVVAEQAKHTKGSFLWTHIYSVSDIICSELQWKAKTDRSSLAIWRRHLEWLFFVFRCTLWDATAMTGIHPRTGCTHLSSFPKFWTQTDQDSAPKIPCSSEDCKRYPLEMAKKMRQPKVNGVTMVVLFLPLLGHSARNNRLGSVLCAWIWEQWILASSICYATAQSGIVAPLLGAGLVAWQVLFWWRLQTISLQKNCCIIPRCISSVFNYFRKSEGKLLRREHLKPCTLSIHM